jgi:GTP-binding protein HflX
VAAFKSTLQETSEADLLLHVVDAASHQRSTCISEVNEVLEQIGAQEVVQIEVFNKIDLLPGRQPVVDRDAAGRIVRVWLSAKTGVGVELLRQALSEHFRHHHVRRKLLLGAREGRLHALLHERGAVLREEGTEEGGWLMEVDMAEREFLRLLREEPALQGCCLDISHDEALGNL